MHGEDMLRGFLHFLVSALWPLGGHLHERQARRVLGVAARGGSVKGVAAVRRVVGSEVVCIQLAAKP